MMTTLPMYLEAFLWLTAVSMLLGIAFLISGWSEYTYRQRGGLAILIVTPLINIGLFLCFPLWLIVKHCCLAVYYKCRKEPDND